MKHYSPAGRRNHGRPLKRLLDTWDWNRSTSGPIPWQIYDDDQKLITIFLKQNAMSECVSNVQFNGHKSKIFMIAEGFKLRYNMKYKP